MKKRIDYFKKQKISKKRKTPRKPGGIKHSVKNYQRK